MEAAHELDDPKNESPRGEIRGLPTFGWSEFSFRHSKARASFVRLLSGFGSSSSGGALPNVL
jgi:hypothetical protein